MSFLDNPKNAGTILWIIGIINMVLGVISIVCGALEIEIDGEKIDRVCGIVNGLGGVIVGFIFFGFGKSIRSGEISEKWDVLTRFILISAMAIAIGGIFSYNDELEKYAANLVVSLIVAFIIFFIYKRMTDGKVDTLDKILWVILVIVFIISAIVDILAMIAFPIGTIMGIAGLIVDLFMLISLLDNDVKAKMGM